MNPELKTLATTMLVIKQPVAKSTMSRSKVKVTD